jgi:hypothetical protein
MMIVLPSLEPPPDEHAVATSATAMIIAPMVLLRIVRMGTPSNDFVRVVVEQRRER